MKHLIAASVFLLVFLFGPSAVRAQGFAERSCRVHLVNSIEDKTLLKKLVDRGAMLIESSPRLLIQGQNWVIADLLEASSLGGLKRVSPTKFIGDLVLLQDIQLQKDRFGLDSLQKRLRLFKISNQCGAVEFITRDQINSCGLSEFQDLHSAINSFCS